MNQRTGTTASHAKAMPELLAPAGGPTAAYAAFRYGADAVYLGLPKFSARAEAENFSPDSLAEVVAFAHAQPVRRKVYVAFNTLVLTRETDEAVRWLQRLAEARVDGVIVQDLGIARLARSHFPDLALHASTQMATHSIEGVRALARLGFSRVVLARELTIGEVGAIAREGGLEVEVFIHGTLCYSYSGLCLFSSHATGRSGNRGACAYCCRATFGVGDGESMPFSMKDLALGDRLDRLREAGVASLKIEGRMKNALYVSAVTDYYRKLLDGQLSEAGRSRLEEDVCTIFSRPWTRLHADGRAPAASVIDAHTAGHRGALIGEVARVRSERDGDWLEFKSRRALEIRDGLQVDLPSGSKPFGFAVEQLRTAGRRATAITVPAHSAVEVRLPGDHPYLPAGAPVYCSSSQEVKRRYPVELPRPGVHRARHPLRVSIRLRPEALDVRGVAEVPSLASIVAKAEMGGPFASARQREGTAAAARKAFERLGDTDWAATMVELDDPQGLFVPASAWNEVRRRLAVALDAARDAAREAGLAGICSEKSPAPPQGKAGECWTLKFDDLPAGWTEEDWEGVSEVVLPWFRMAGDPPLVGPGGLPLRAAIPAILRAEAISAARRRISELLRDGLRTWEVASLAGLELLREEAHAGGIDAASLDVSSDWCVHTMNPLAAAAGSDLGIARFVTSPEEDGENVMSLLREQGTRALVLVLQFSPLFEAETLPAAPAHVTQFGGRRGERYVELEEHGLHVLISRSPFALPHHLARLRAGGARGFRADFSRAAAANADVRELWRRARAGEKIPDSHQGNFVRGLQ